mgnify:CR=1 FL=1
MVSLLEMTLSCVLDCAIRGTSEGWVPVKWLGLEKVVAKVRLATGVTEARGAILAARRNGVARERAEDEAMEGDIVVRSKEVSPNL